ncbi:hypothetical protein AB1Y20_006395 [Prymnesium parvum]|uniref:Chromo domain-containing protein n=1 Tax=Prymnesium parvum TaxID=97485 RepID=A0AB34J3T6_PRYPA
MPGTKKSGKRKTAPPQNVIQKPQGQTGKQRTPIGAFDPAAGKDIYEPEMICGQRMEKGVTKFLVKWVGYAERANAWEPIEHLASCEDLIVEFKERKKIRLAQLDAAAEKARIEKEARLRVSPPHDMAS